MQISIKFNIHKAIKQICAVVLPLCFAALLTQSAFCYNLSSDELNKIIFNRINKETKEYLGNIEYKINIQGALSDVITNDTNMPKVEITPLSEFGPITYRRVSVKDSKGNTVKTFALNIRTLIYMNTIVALDTIPYGRNVDSTNTTIEKREVSRFFDKVLTNLPNNSIASRGISKGSVIQNSYIKQKAIIEKNQNVDIVFQGKGVQIALKGKALKEGARGEIIPVRSDKYNKTYSATVETNSKVTVRI